MTLAFLDCFSGVAGDMFVGALLDLGLPISDLRQAVAGLELPGVSLHSESVRRGSLCGKHFRVHVEGGGQSHRHLSEILQIIERAGLPTWVEERSKRVFEVIGAVESQVHGVDIERVHFHEVGAEDTIVDIVCAVLGCHLLGFDEIYSSAVVTGRGTVACEHGDMPVPAPGALGNLLGIPLRTGGPRGECVTPTGAGLLRVLVDGFEPDLLWVPRRIGYGAGTRDDPAYPNLLRITTGVRAGVRAGVDQPATSLVELACNLDTATGEQIAYLIDGLLARGAVDAFAQPIQMKKGRPAWQLTALCDDAHRVVVTEFLLEESSSLGVRVHRVERDVLERHLETVDTEFGPVRFKVAKLPSGVLLRRPEEDDVRRLATEHGLGRREVLARLTRRDWNRDQDQDQDQDQD